MDAITNIKKSIQKVIQTSPNVIIIEYLLLLYFGETDGIQTHGIKLKRLVPYHLATVSHIILEGRKGVEPSCFLLQSNAVFRRHFWYRPLYIGLKSRSRTLSTSAQNLDATHTPISDILWLRIQVTILWLVFQRHLWFHFTNSHYVLAGLRRLERRFSRVKVWRDTNFPTSQYIFSLSNVFPYRSMFLVG